MLHTPRARVTRLVCQVFFVLLIALLLGDTFWSARNPEISLALVLSVKLIPLLVFIPVVMSGSNRGLIWLSFVLIFYFTQFVVNAWLSEGEPGATANALVTVLLFVSAMVHLKINRPE